MRLNETSLTVFPLGHATLGYLLYVPFALLTDRRLPYGLTLGVLLVGTQFPDLVDKPLAFVGVLPTGRTLAHSLLFAVVLLVVLRSVTRRYGRPNLTIPFAFGYLSHLLGDVVVPLMAGRIGELTFLLWPVLPSPEYGADNVPPWIRIVRFYASPEFSPELLLVPVAFATFVLVELRRRRGLVQ
jgi:membrane-bound metal-dependent hydrolase YbcI (DUF457 family)